jgi:hypothetical protein
VRADLMLGGMAPLPLGRGWGIRLTRFMARVSRRASVLPRPVQTKAGAGFRTGEIGAVSTLCNFARLAGFTPERVCGWHFSCCMGGWKQVLNLRVKVRGVMNQLWHSMDCKVVFEPAQSDRFYMDMRVYQVVKSGMLRPSGANTEVWRGVYLAVEVKPWLDTGRQIKAG